MTEQQENFNSLSRDPSVILSAKELQAKRFKPLSHNPYKKKTPLRLQKSKPPPNSVKLKPEKIPVHFIWALVSTILCFFLIGPCWALYKTIQLRRMIERQELDGAEHLAHKITSVLFFSTIVGIFVWVAILFCSVGIVITGALLDKQLI